MTRYPELVNRAVARLASQGQGIHAATGWEWTVAHGEERLAVDEWIIATKHPLGNLPSTAEQRFRLLVQEANDKQQGVVSADQMARYL